MRLFAAGQNTSEARLAPTHTALKGQVLASVSFENFLIAVAIDCALATLIFRHAYRRGNANAMAWGVFTFLAAMIAIPIYFLTYWLHRRRRL